MVFNVESIRSQFPILKTQVNGKPLLYLDNAATTQKPQLVIDRINRYYREENANTHSVHFLASNLASELKKTREVVKTFIGAYDSREIVFTKSATESLNLIAFGLEKFIQAGDEIVTTVFEHHANFLPWQRLAQNKKASLKLVNLDPSLELDLVDLSQKITSKTKILSITQVSNVLGKINPISEIVKIARKNNPDIIIVVDACQSAPHLQLEVLKWDIDFLVFSGHKLYAPLGIGVLFGKLAWLEKLPVYQVGGDMVESVTTLNSSFQEPPTKFEAGTLNFEGILGLQTALEFLTDCRKTGVSEYEQKIADYLYDQLNKISDLILLGSKENRLPLVSFYHPKISGLDLARYLDSAGIAVRDGSLCNQILLQTLGINSVVRVSLAIYNTIQEIDNLTKKLNHVITLLS